MIFDGIETSKTNNIAVYKEKGKTNFLSWQDYEKILKGLKGNEKTKFENKYESIAIGDPYYIFFKEEIQRKCAKQIKMEI